MRAGSKSAVKNMRSNLLWKVTSIELFIWKTRLSLPVPFLRLPCSPLPQAHRDQENITILSWPILQSPFTSIRAFSALSACKVCRNVRSGASSLSTSSLSELLSFEAHFCNNCIIEYLAHWSTIISGNEVSDLQLLLFLQCSSAEKWRAYSSRLRRVRLQWARLRRARLRRAKLRRANLRWARLQRVRLRWATCYHVAWTRTSKVQCPWARG